MLRIWQRTDQWKAPVRLINVTVQFEIEGNGQNEIVSHMDRPEVKL